MFWGILLGTAAAAGTIGSIVGAVALRRAQNLLKAARAELRKSVADTAERDASRTEALTLVRDTLEATPFAILVFSEGGRIGLANAAARELLFEGSHVEGQNFLTMLDRAPLPLRHALLSDGEELFTIEKDGEAETFLLAKRYLSLGGEPQTLVAVKPMGYELVRQENATLKKVIHILGHEISNSLGPVSSLIRSARTLVTQPEGLAKLGKVFDTVEERALHLQSFLEGYAKLSRVPDPRLQLVDCASFVQGITALWPQLNASVALGLTARFDMPQIQQVLINLIKNAHEASGANAEVSLELNRGTDGGVRLVVSDRGKGFSDEALSNAFLPFFSTKPNGSGLGLALCREIAERHRGRLRLHRREGGGVSAVLWLPDDPTSMNSLTASRVFLSLSHV